MKIKIVPSKRSCDSCLYAKLIFDFNDACVEFIEVLVRLEIVFEIEYVGISKNPAILLPLCVFEKMELKDVEVL